MDFNGADSYLEEVHQLLSRRFGYPLSLSPRDLDEIEYWRERAVPVAAVELGVGEALGGLAVESAERRVPPLVYCRRSVLAAAAELRRRGVIQPTGDGDEPEKKGGPGSTGWAYRELWRRLPAEERRRLSRRVGERLGDERQRMSPRAYGRTFLALLNRDLRTLKRP